MSSQPGSSTGQKDAGSVKKAVARFRACDQCRRRKGTVGIWCYELIETVSCDSAL